VAAYFVRGVAGFGSGLIAIPLLVLMLPLSVAVPLVVLLDYVASASHGIRHRQAVRWQDIWPLLPFTLCGVAVALYLFKNVDAQLLGRALGVFVIVYALYTLMAGDVSSRVSRLWAVPAGGLGGLIGTLFGTGGPFYVLYLKHRGLAKTPFRATFATIFLLDGASRLGGYLLSGLYQVGMLPLIAAALPLMAIGLYLGGNVHTAISQQTFQRVISALLLVSGASLLIK